MFTKKQKNRTTIKNKLKLLIQLRKPKTRNDKRRGRLTLIWSNSENKCSRDLLPVKDAPVQEWPLIIQWSPLLVDSSPWLEIWIIRKTWIQRKHLQDLHWDHTKAKMITLKRLSISLREGLGFMKRMWGLRKIKRLTRDLCLVKAEYRQ